MSTVLFPYFLTGQTKYFCFLFCCFCLVVENYKSLTCMVSRYNSCVINHARTHTWNDDMNDVIRHVTVFMIFFLSSYIELFLIYLIEPLAIASSHHSTTQDHVYCYLNYTYHNCSILSIMLTVPMYTNCPQLSAHGYDSFSKLSTTCTERLHEYTADGFDMQA